MKTIIVVLFGLIFIACDNAVVDKISKEITPINSADKNKEYLIQKEIEQNKKFKDLQEADTERMLKFVQLLKNKAKSDSKEQYFSVFNLNDEQILKAARDFCTLPNNLKQLNQEDFDNGVFDDLSSSEIVKLMRDYQYLVPYYTKCDKDAFATFLHNNGVVEKESKHKEGYYYNLSTNILKQIAIYQTLSFYTNFSKILFKRSIKEELAKNY